MCFYFNDETEEKKIETFLYQQNTNVLHPGTLSPLPTQFFNIKQIHQQFIFNKYAYELSVLNSKLKDLTILEKEKEKLKNSLSRIRQMMDSEIDDVNKLFEDIK